MEERTDLTIADPLVVSYFSNEYKGRFKDEILVVEGENVYYNDKFNYDAEYSKDIIARCAKHRLERSRFLVIASFVVVYVLFCLLYFQFNEWVVNNQFNAIVILAIVNVLLIAIGVRLFKVYDRHYTSSDTAMVIIVLKDILFNNFRKEYNNLSISYEEFIKHYNHEVARVNPELERVVHYKILLNVIKKNYPKLYREHMLYLATAKNNNDNSVYDHTLIQADNVERYS